MLIQCHILSLPKLQTKTCSVFRVWYSIPGCRHGDGGDGGGGGEDGDGVRVGGAHRGVHGDGVDG